MKYVAIDLETTGLDPIRDQILQFGAVIGDTGKLDTEDWPGFEMNMKLSRVEGDPVALAMNAGILKEISDSVNTVDADTLAVSFRDWLKDSGFPVKNPRIGDGILESVIAAGKNFGSFDLQFIKQWWNYSLLRLVPFKHRILDVGSMWSQADDVVIPDLEECKRRAGVKGRVSHRALDDAHDVVACVQAWFRKQAVLEQLAGASRRLVSTPAHSDAFPGMALTVRALMEKL